MHPLYFSDKAPQEILKTLIINKINTIAVLVDSNTKQYCLPKLLQVIGDYAAIKIFEIPAGEEHKSIETAIQLWKNFLDKGIHKNTLVLNLGGGVITDLGGMLAACYKRGLAFVQVPTSVLGMVDAAIGGKNGVDFMGYKNQIGTICMPAFVWIEPDFIDSLNKRQLINGFAEMLKHALIADKTHWQELKKINPTNLDVIKKHIPTSALIKKHIVQKDPSEHKERLFLNFGHSIGHAIESALIRSKKPILHGEAIAIGMLIESYLSTQFSGLDNRDFLSIKNCLIKLYPQINITDELKTSILEFIKHDKKALSSGLRIVLLEAIGKPIIRNNINSDVIESCLDWYQNEISPQNH